MITTSEDGTSSAFHFLLVQQLASLPGKPQRRFGGEVGKILEYPGMF